MHTQNSQYFKVFSSIKSVVFVNTNPKNERIAVLKNKDSLSQLNDDDTDVFQKSLIDRYQHRPQQLNSMCLAEFAATYVANYKPDDAIPALESDTTSTQITLTDGFGKMNKHKQEAVIRFRKHNKETDPTNWYRAKLMLYYPWFDEQTDLLGGYPSYETHYRHVCNTMRTNESKYTKEDIDNIDVDENGPPEHWWDNIGLSDAGTRLLFKFRSGTHGLNEELGRHRGREGKKECVLCGDECESVSHTLWDCSAYTSIRAQFLLKLKASLGGSYASFEAMSSLDKSSFVLGNELWEEHFESLLALVKAYVIDIWEERKSKL